MNVRQRVLLFACFAFAMAPRISQAQGERRFLNGQNLSVTSDTLEPGRCAIGLDLVACGLTDHFTIGTSTWLWQSYNMANIAARYRFGETPDGDLWATQFSYFQTYRERNVETFDSGTYQMRAFWAMLVRTWQLAPHYRLHLNFHANYYADEKMPFSLRRPYPTATPYQFNLTTLHELNLTGAWYIFGEVGLLDFARAPMHLHVGSSIGQAWRHFEWHLGFSMTGTEASLFSPVSRFDYQQYLRAASVDGYEGFISPDGAQNDFSIHPEFSLQFLF